MFLLFPQVSRNWRYESEPPLKPSPLTCYKQFGTNSIIVLMFLESQRVHIWSTCKVCNKTWSVVLLNKKIHLLLSQVYCVWQVVKTPTFISNNPEFWAPLSIVGGTRCCSWLRQCVTSRKVAGFIPDGVIDAFHLLNPSGRSMALGSTQPLTEMNTRSISWVGKGVQAASA